MSEFFTLALCESHVRASTHLALCQLAIDEGGKLPEWVELVPPGVDINAIDGRKFRNPSPLAVVEAFRKYGRHLPVDYEHASEIRAPEGKDAPAAGWIVDLEVRDGGAIWGKIEWTPRGVSSLTNREYRYISPAFIHNNRGEIKELVSAGLTNKPALPQLAELARHQEGVDQMDPELLKALGLKEDATKEQVLAAIAAAQKAKQDAEAAVAASQSELATARSELERSKTPDLNQFVPRGDYALAIARAEKAEKEIADHKALAHKTAVDLEIEAAMKAGKVTPASKDFYVSICSQPGGLEKFREFVKGAPVVGAPSPLEGQKPQEGGPTVTEEMVAIAARCNISKDQLLAQLKAQ